MATQAQIKAAVKKCVAEAKRLYGYTIKYEELEITFKSKGRAAASAWWKTRLGHRVYGLRFSMESASYDSDEMLNDTVPHEVAHLVCMWNDKLGKDHDSGWKRVCIALGGTGARTHDQELTKARYKTQYLYQTPSGAEFKFGAKRHKTCLRGGSYRTNRGETINSSCFVRVISSAEHKREHMKKVNEARAAAGSPRIPTTSHKRPTPRTPTTGSLSKKQQAEMIYRDIVGRGHGKAICIQRFIDVLNMTPAGAQTYYYNCKKAIG